MAKEESIGLRIRRTFPNKEIIEDLYVKKLDCITDFYFPKRRLEIEVDELGHVDRDQITETKRQKKQKNILDVHLLELMLMKKILVFMMDLVKYIHLLIS